MDDQFISPEDDPTTDVAGHRLAANDDETVVDDAPDVAGHRLAANDDETVVDDQPTSPAIGWPRMTTRPSSTTHRRRRPSAGCE